MSTSGPVTRGRGLPRPIGLAGVTAGGIAVVLVCLPAGYGWLYLLRGLHWFRVGPPVGDALPLLQLAGFDAQALLRVVVAWLLAGLIAGVALVGVRPARRVALTGPPALALLLLASQAAYALTRNLRFNDVVLSRRPGLGPVLEALVFSAGCALPRRRPRPPGQRPGPPRAGGRRRHPVGRRLHRIGELGLRRGQHRYPSEHDGDRHQVQEDGGGSGAE